MPHRPSHLLASLAGLLAVLAMTGSFGCYFPPPNLRASESLEAELRAGEPARQFRVTISANPDAVAMGTTVRFSVTPQGPQECSPGTDVTIAAILREVDGTVRMGERTADRCDRESRLGFTFDALELETCGESGCSTAVDVFLSRADEDTSVVWAGELSFAAALENGDQVGDASMDVQVSEIAR